MTSRDHTVPQLYLRRFAVRRKQQWFLSAEGLDGSGRIWETNVSNVASPKGFYSFTGIDGLESREVDDFLQRIETLMTPVFTTLLDDPRFALAEKWPLEPELRLRLAWFMAAQVLRTTRQRKRLATAPHLTLPGQIRETDQATDHARFIVNQIGALAYILHARPWCLGISSACLITSDTPVVIMNGQDDDNQLLAAGYWEVLMPLDPHRFILLPGSYMVERDPRKSTDHRAKFDGVGAALTQAVYDAADSYAFYHPHHPPQFDLRSGGRLPAPGEDRKGAPRYMLEYGVLPPHLTVLKRWAHEHHLATE